MPYYYGDLSSCSSEDLSSSDDEENSTLYHSKSAARSKPSSGGPTESESANNPNHDTSGIERRDYDVPSSDIWSRTIIHLDIDCFYCQCEEIDRNLRHENPPRPLAIGQKHIIVTSTYEARKYGVKKLQTREAAMAACPHLWIVEGSDLEHYRKHSRAVYEAFRGGLQDITNELLQPPRQSQQSQRRYLIDHKGSNEKSLKLPAQKGSGMDEMMADITWAVEQESHRHPEQHENRLCDNSIYIYGETRDTSTAVLVEDQTGAQAVVSGQPTRCQNQSIESTRYNVHQHYGTDLTRLNCVRRLQIASRLVSRLRKHVFEQTQFYTTIGISVSPMLAKLATGLQKPDSINILYPWRSANFMESMPLRKLHGVGRGTIKALDECLELHSVGPRPEFWTIRDLLRLPKNRIAECLESVKTFTSTSEQHCALILQNCRGLDETRIVDDQGGVPKTLSCENSFRRGTLRSMEGVWVALDQLFERLPRLLKDRTSWSQCPSKAFPLTLRLTARVVNESLRSTKRRPFVTRSIQCRFDGQRLLKIQELARQSEMIKHAVTPLVRQLLGSRSTNDLDVTRLNIALTNFQDTPDSTNVGGTKSSAFVRNGSQGRPKKTTVGPTVPAVKVEPVVSSLHSKAVESGCGKDECVVESNLNHSRINPTMAITHEEMPSKEREYRTVAATKTSLQKRKRPLVANRNRAGSRKSLMSYQVSHHIDPTVLAALPEDIADEIRRAYPQQSKKTKIDQFFVRK